FAANWQACDAYGLRHLVGHLRARLDLDRMAEETREAGELYAVVLSDAFRAAQCEKLDDIHATLGDLLTALDLALERDDWVMVLKCAAAYPRRLVRSSVAVHRSRVTGV